MRGLFGEPDGAIVTRLTPDKSAPQWTHIIVGRRRMARAPTAGLREVGIDVGSVWSSDLAGRVKLACDVMKAKLRAVGLLQVRARSAAELASRLTRAGFAPEIVTAAIDQLRQSRLIDDDSLAESRAEAALGKGIARAEIRRRLSAAGIAEDKAAAATAGAGDDLARAIAEVRNRTARFPESLGATTRFRRVLGALARLGYEEDVAREAAEAVIGKQDDQPG